MIEIETFLRDESGEFVRVESCRNPPPDSDYIEGAIRLSVGGVEVIGTEEWDYVDQLWCYLADMVPKVRSVGNAETFFPDQPIRLSLQATGSRILVTAKIGEEVRRASGASAELLEALKAAGTVFFAKMSELVPQNSYAEAQRELAA
ncbi:hypothetical protein AB0D35_09290 [Streptomyces sp. NPDC048301]|uniref:hypothetical protein n=1 Tax=Streptomyces sp. NPDC048301 TaxID=3155631 RepID=UPI003419CEC5